MQSQFPGIDAAFARIRTNLRAKIAGLAISPDPTADLAAIQKEITALEAMATVGLKSQANSKNKDSE